MKRAFALLLLTSLTLACGPAATIWGTAQTPTPMTSNPLLADPLAVPTETVFPPFFLHTATPTAAAGPLDNTPFMTATPSPSGSLGPPTYTPTFDTAPVLYYSQSGDSLAAVASRFNVAVEEITSNVPLPSEGLIDAGTLLIIPDRISEPTTPNIQIMPDNEIIFSATAADFDVESFVKEAGGHLSTFREYLGSTGWADGHEAISRVAIENSVNPRILLGVLEYESRWVTGEPVDLMHTDYPMGYEDFRYKGMFIQMVWAVNQLSNGYYGWRAGTLTHLSFRDGTRLRIDPRLNAGTVAIQYLFSRLHSQSQWAQIINPATGFPAMYAEMFNDPWTRANLVNPLFPPGMKQPDMVLPFEPGALWSYTGGPHGAFEKEGALAALDFAPSADRAGCDESPLWLTAITRGLVVRSDLGVVVMDMDGDGHEQTGWNLVYLHVATKDRVQEGTWLEQDERIGHASCEGGVSTGTHVHVARKYNGEWIAADGPLPFVLSGWRATYSGKPYLGTLVKGEQTITADLMGQLWSNIRREDD